MAAAAPSGLDTRGRRLWRDTVKALGELDPAQRELLLEACRMADRLDHLDHQIRTGESFLKWHLSVDEPDVVEVRVHGALAAASRDANVLKQLLVALRLPDAETGKRPQVRGARGAYTPAAPTGPAKSSARDRLKAV